MEIQWQGWSVYKTHLQSHICPHGTPCNNIYIFYPNQTCISLQVADRQKLVRASHFPLYSQISSFPSLSVPLAFPHFLIFCVLPYHPTNLLLPAPPPVFSFPSFSMADFPWERPSYWHWAWPSGVTASTRAGWEAVVWIVGLWWLFLGISSIKGHDGKEEEPF